MPGKHPTWARSRAGRDRVHWVAYDDGPGAEGRQVVDQGYAPSLAEADRAARAALAEAGMFGARRQSAAPGLRARPARAAGPAPGRPREYLYRRHRDGPEGGPFVAAHLVLRRTPRKVFVTRRSVGADQLGTEDEAWGPDEPSVALDRARLDRDGSAPSGRFRLSEFFRSRAEAAGDAAPVNRAAFDVLGIRPPCSVGDIKAAYRRRALEAHPDRGGGPDDFRAVEDAYRRLLVAARASAG